MPIIFAAFTGSTATYGSTSPFRYSLPGCPASELTQPTYGLGPETKTTVDTEADAFGASAKSRLAASAGAELRSLIAPPFGCNASRHGIPNIPPPTTPRVNASATGSTHARRPAG